MKNVAEVTWPYPDCVIATCEGVTVKQWHGLWTGLDWTGLVSAGLRRALPTMKDTVQ